MNSPVCCGSDPWLRNFLATVQLLWPVGSLAKVEYNLFSGQFNEFLFLLPQKKVELEEAKHEQ